MTATATRAGAQRAGIQAAPAPTIVVTGSIHYDMMLRLPHLPRANDRINIEGMSLAPGGMGGNVAAVAARLGARVRFAGLFAGDEDGEQLRADLEQDGVDCAWSIRRDGPGWRGFILAGESGERAIIAGWQPNQPLDRAPGRPPGGEVAPHRFSGRSFLEQFDAVMRSPGLFEGGVDALVCPAAFAFVAMRHLPAETPLFIDVETGHLDGIDAALVWAMLKRTTVIFGNERNLEHLVRMLDLDGAEHLAVLLDSMVVMTCGARGCTVFEPQTIASYPGFSVESVDTTGAGDAFAAAFTVALLQGEGIARAATFANAAAALSTTALGSRAGVPSRHEVIRLAQTAVS